MCEVVKSLASFALRTAPGLMQRFFARPKTFDLRACRRSCDSGRIVNCSRSLITAMLAARSRVVAGRRMTEFNDSVSFLDLVVQPDAEGAGATWVRDAAIVADGNLVTSAQPRHFAAFSAAPGVAWQVTTRVRRLEIPEPVTLKSDWAFALAPFDGSLKGDIPKDLRFTARPWITRQILLKS